MSWSSGIFDDPFKGSTDLLAKLCHIWVGNALSMLLLGWLFFFFPYSFTHTPSLFRSILDSDSVINLMLFILCGVVGEDYVVREEEMSSRNKKLRIPVDAVWWLCGIFSKARPQWRRGGNEIAMHLHRLLICFLRGLIYCTVGVSVRVYLLVAQCLFSTNPRTYTTLVSSRKPVK